MNNGVYSPFPPNASIWECGRKPECLERIDADSERTCKLHTAVSLGIQTRNLQTGKFTTAPPLKKNLPDGEIQSTHTIGKKSYQPEKWFMGEKMSWGCSAEYFAL